MSNQFHAIRGLVIYGVSLMLAIILGFMLASPENQQTLIVFGLVFSLLSLPLLMRWHHPALVLCWNMFAVVFFLPGHLPAWVVMSVLSLGVSVFQRSLNRGMKFLPAWSVVMPLVVLGLVVLGTAKLTGGISFRSEGGGTYGGRRYFLVLAAIVGFFALTSRRIPVSSAGRYAALFFLSGITVAIGQLVTVVNPAWYIIFIVFPPDLSGFERAAMVTGDVIERLGGVSTAASFILFFMLSRFGIQKAFTFRNSWQVLFWAVLLVAGTLGGFRSILISMALTFGLVFCLEGLWRTRFLPMFVMALIIISAVLVPFMEELPLSVQRTFSFLPIRVHPGAAADAMASSEWRLRMWEIVLPEVPEYLWLGKGYGIKGDDLELAQNLAMSGRGDTAEVAMLAGDYHNGPLSVLIPFGVWGALAFVWFLIAAGRALYRNHKYGVAQLKHINTFLFAFFLTRLVLFFAVAGSFYTDLAVFTGLVGFGISLNGGICGPKQAENEPEAAVVETVPIRRKVLSPLAGTTLPPH